MPRLPSRCPFCKTYCRPVSSHVTDGLATCASPNRNDTPNLQAHTYSFSLPRFSPVMTGLHSANALALASSGGSSHSSLALAPSNVMEAPVVLFETVQVAAAAAVVSLLSSASAGMGLVFAPSTGEVNGLPLSSSAPGMLVMAPCVPRSPFSVTEGVFISGLM